LLELGNFGKQARQQKGDDGLQFCSNSDVASAARIFSFTGYTSAPPRENIGRPQSTRTCIASSTMRGISPSRTMMIGSVSGSR
jgi:hypothetical protein